MAKLNTTLLRDLDVKTTIGEDDYVIVTSPSTKKMKIKDITKDIEKKVVVLEEKTAELSSQLEQKMILIVNLQNRVTALENQQSTTVGVTGVSLNNTTLTLNAGSTSTLIATVLPSNATNKSVTWSTNNSSVASVNNGTVTAVSTGSAIITASTVDGNYTATCSITVTANTVSVTGVNLSAHTLEMSSIGETYTINYTISPNNATNKNITWSSSEPTVATIEDHLITAKGDGTAIISITTADGGYSDYCTVTVNTSTVVAGSYVTDESGNRLMAENGSYLITD